MSQSNRRRGSKRNRASQYSFSSLESRRLLAGISFDSATGVVKIEGTSGDDYVQLAHENSEIKVTYHGVEQQYFATQDVSKIEFFGFDGDDWFKNATVIGADAFGHNGDDVLIGGAAEDRMIGGQGNDYLVGAAGDDYLDGEGDDDRVLGNGGDDTLLGGSGADRMVGGDGNDFMYGDRGEDLMFGLAGDDWIEGGDGDDVLIGNQGKDRMQGDSGNDRLLGGDDDDEMHGDDGDDEIYAGAGNDMAYGDDGVDRIVGHAGIDELFGNFGDDFLYGNDGDDMLRGNEGHDRIVGGLGDDVLYGDDDNDFLDGQDGNDRIHAGRGDDYARGGQGRDDLYGDEGNDALDGGGDNDDLVGGLDQDWMKGGHGNDDYQDDDSDRLVDDQDDYDASDDFEIRGVISQLDSAAGTFSLLGLTVDFSSAEIEGLVEDGAFVEVEGTFDGSVLTAREVEHEFEQNGDNFEARGLVENLNAEMQTFNLFGIPVSFADAEVDGNLQDGAPVKVEGRLSDGQVAAREVESSLDGEGGDGDIDQDSDGYLELRGNIQNLDAINQTFVVLGIPVSYAGAQVESALTEGAFFKIEGRYNGSQLVAREIESELPGDDNDENIEARGRVSQLDTTNMTFQLLGFTIDYSNAEIEEDFGEGDSVSIEGWLDNGVVVAEEIEQ